MNWNYAPGTLNAELFEECGGDHRMAAGERVRIKQDTTDKRDNDNGEAAPKYL